jgi:hypothetical protein
LPEASGWASVWAGDAFTFILLLSSLPAGHAAYSVLSLSWRRKRRVLPFNWSGNLAFEESFCRQGLSAAGRSLKGPGNRE